VPIWENFVVMSPTAYAFKHGAGLAGADVREWAGSATIDTRTLTQWADSLLSMARGSWTVSGTTIKFFKQDGTTLLYRLSLGATARDLL
jgi:hypothetical protein